MVQAILNTSVCCSILSHDVLKFVYFIPQLRNLKTVKSCTLKDFYINNIYTLMNECLKGKARGVFSLFYCKGGKSVQRGKSPQLLYWLHNGAALANFKGIICEKAEILSAV